MTKRRENERERKRHTQGQSVRQPPVSQTRSRTHRMKEK